MNPYLSRDKSAASLSTVPLLKVCGRWPQIGSWHILMVLLKLPSFLFSLCWRVNPELPASALPTSCGPTFSFSEFVLRQGLSRLPRLTQGRAWIKNPPASASRIAGIIDLCHHAGLDGVSTVNTREDDHLIPWSLYLFLYL